METKNLALEARTAARLSQEVFATTFRIPLSTVRKNEQSVNQPRGAAKVYYQLIATYPEEMKAKVQALP